MRKLKEHKLASFLILATIAGIICLGVFGASRGSSSAAERVGGDALSKPQGFFSSVGNFFGNIGDYFGSNKKLRAENEKLKNENTNLQKQINDTKDMQKENDELKKMLDLKKTQVDLTLIASTVSAKDPSGWFSAFTIDKGSKDGIKENQPVVNSNRELIGRISRVGDNWAEVITLLDPKISVGASVKRSGAVGVIEGSPSLRYDNMCSLGYMSRDTDISIGDYVETSGLGGIFPKGLIIGTVEYIKDDSSTMSRSASVKLCADVTHINEVFVISDFKTTDLSESEVTTGENKKDKKSDLSSTSDDDEDYEDDGEDEDY